MSNTKVLEGEYVSKETSNALEYKKTIFKYDATLTFIYLSGKLQSVFIIFEDSNSMKYIDILVQLKIGPLGEGESTTKVPFENYMVTQNGGFINIAHVWKQKNGFVQLVEYVDKYSHKWCEVMFYLNDD